MTWDAHGLAPSVYFYQLNADGRSEVKKPLFLK